MIALVQELRHRAASFQSLQGQPDKALSTLKNKATYASAANKILRESIILYPEKEDTSFVSAYLHKKPSSHFQIETIHHIEALTIR